MKARRILAIAGAMAAVLAVAGCPLTGLLPGPTTPTPPTFSADSKLIGRFTFGGSSPSATGLKAKYRAAGQSVAADAAIADVDAQGYFSFTDSKITAGSDYQVVWDDQGKIVESADVNTMGLYVSDSIKALGASDAKTVQKEMDVKWEGAYGVAPKGTFVSKFTFQKIANLDADYFVSTFTAPTSTDVTKTNPTACWSSTAGSGNEVTWDKTCSSTIGGTGGTAPSGDLYYQVKFVKKGTAQSFSGKKDFFGQTKYVPFKI
ncbi:MAG: hypothetical protein FJZ01_21005 [Candidatus Sericytochromatia bacterium]|nr:hypothetical protein [Candidatus Tanganyikabacteria bacterium]